MFPGLTAVGSSSMPNRVESVTDFPGSAARQANFIARTQKTDHIAPVQIPISDAKARLSELAEIASGGEEIILTVHGEPKARLVPLVSQEGPSWDEIMAPIREAAKNIKPEDRKPNPILEERRLKNARFHGVR
jgi:prevent-host-death family protein